MNQIAQLQQLTEKQVVGILTKFAIANNEFCKRSFTPSVSLSVTYQPPIQDLFYRGQVFIELKDEVCQALSPIKMQQKSHQFWSKLI